MTFGTKTRVRETQFFNGLEMPRNSLENFIPPKSAAWIFVGILGKKIGAPPPTRRFAGTGALEATGLGHLVSHGQGSKHLKKSSTLWGGGLMYCKFFEEMIF